MYFGENGIIKSVFHKYKKAININEVDIEEIVLSHKNHIVKIKRKHRIKLMSAAPKLMNCKVNTTYFVKNYKILLKYFNESNLCVV